MSTLSVTIPAARLARLRVETVGSFLRPERLKAAYDDLLQGRCASDHLKSVQDESIRDLIAAQEAHGLPVVTDGEFRRFNYMESFALVAGMEGWKARWSQLVRSLGGQEGDGASPRQGVNPLLMKLEGVTERLELVRNHPLAEYAFAQRLARSPVKVPLINPDRVMQSIDVEKSRDVYPDADGLMDDVVRVQREMINGLRAAGCQYIHLDAPGYTAYVDPASLDRMRERGEDPDALLERAIAADNALIEGFGDLTFGVHMCRGNRHSQWHREGSYDPIAERLFSGLQCDRFMLEYDDSRAGSFEPLRFVPKDKVVVLGLITTKSSRIETKDEVKARIEAAAKYLPIEQLALSPQCGFASDLVGNNITQDAQWRKLDLMLEVASEIWGTEFAEQADSPGEE